MPNAADLAAAVGQRLEATPYRIVDPRPDGFTLVLDLADARWWGLLSRSGLRETFAHVVRVAPDGRRYEVTDERTQVEWTVGASGPVPRLGASLSSFRGTTWTTSRRTVVGVSDAGRVEPVVDYAFTSATGRQIVADAAAGLGMQARMSAATRTGVAWAVFGGVMALVGVGFAVAAAIFATGV